MVVPPVVTLATAGAVVAADFVIADRTENF